MAYTPARAARSRRRPKPGPPRAPRWVGAAAADGSTARCDQRKRL